MTELRHRGRPRLPRRRTGSAVAAAVLVALGLALGGCSKTPENCLIEDEGFLSFEILPEGNDTFTGRFTRMEELFTSPPTVRYHFARDGAPEVLLDTPDVLGYRFDLVPGRTYTGAGEEVIDSHLEAYALSLSDSLGVAVLVESDWQARNNRADQLFDYVYKDGYPVAGLTVNFEDSGCESRVALTADYQSITNWNLVFSLTGGPTVSSGHRRTFGLGVYEVHVFRAERREPKFEEGVQPQLSWAMQRIDS